MVTSDGCMDLYPDNMTSDFRIMLKDPIDVGDDWEVGLLSINYPYSLINVGPGAKVFMKYYIDGVLQEINFPNWQSQSVQEVVKFIEKRIASKEEERKPGSSSDIVVGFDDLMRFKMWSTSMDFDVGFSPNLMKLLGLAGHERADNMTLDAFEKRMGYRDLLARVTKDGNPIKMTEQLHTLLRTNHNVSDLIVAFKPFVDVENLQALESLGEVPDDSKIYRDVNLDKVYLLGQLGIHSHISEHWEKVAAFLYYLKKLHVYGGNHPIRKIRAVTPGAINPVQRMFVYTNIMEPMDMNDGAKKLLKMVNTRGEPFKTTRKEFNHPLYHPISRGGKISMIHVYIADETGDAVPFQTGTVVLTLRFRKSGRA
jgi:hypothetical protein